MCGSEYQDKYCTVSMIKKYLKLFLSETSEPFDNKYGWNGA
jgi:hypothetical protein